MAGCYADTTRGVHEALLFRLNRPKTLLTVGLTAMGETTEAGH